uniref:DNA-directed RNA polymerase n=1 Tax=Astrephomene gubernaculifera TaxID=47775 RepID=A0A7R6ULG8_9CHLO|nr:RNA polymerase alpha subunit [Astrephomene gubernaculifera]
MNLIKKTNFKNIMANPQTTDFFIACKESRIENNTSFYGCFYLGPFDDSLSQTLANDLRRTLLSELTGLAITSIEIDGVLHKFSSVPGMKESVLDLICNLQSVVLKKEHPFQGKQTNSSGLGLVNNTTLSPTKKTYTGFLNISGPRVIKAIDLKLPAGLQCVDPNQYIATLADDGILNMKFNINEGKNFIKQKAQNLEVNTLKKRNILLENFKRKSQKKVAILIANKSLKNSIKIKGLTMQKLLKTAITKKNKSSKGVFLSNPIPLDAVFMPVTKINCIIEENNLYSNFSTDTVNFENQNYNQKKVLTRPKSSTLTSNIIYKNQYKYLQKNLLKINNNISKTKTKINGVCLKTKEIDNKYNFQSFLNRIDYSLIYQMFLTLQKNENKFKNQKLFLESQPIKVLNNKSKTNLDCVSLTFQNHFKLIPHFGTLYFNINNIENQKDWKSLVQPPHILPIRSIGDVHVDKVEVRSNLRDLQLQASLKDKAYVNSFLSAKSYLVNTPYFGVTKSINKVLPKIKKNKKSQLNKKNRSFDIINKKFHYLSSCISSFSKIKTFLAYKATKGSLQPLVQNTNILKQNLALKKTKNSKPILLDKTKIKEKKQYSNLTLSVNLKKQSPPTLTTHKHCRNIKKADKTNMLKITLNKQKKYFKVNPIVFFQSQKNLYLEYSKHLKLKPLRKKSNVIVEIWTNGSIHPRQALYQSFNFLSNTFLKLQTVKMLSKFNLNKMSKASQVTSDHVSKNKLLKQVPSYSASPSQYKGKHDLLFKSEFTYDDFYLQTSLKAPIGILKISLRTYTALKKASIFTLKDLIKYSKKDLLKIKNLGTKSLFEIETCLSYLGLTLNHKD